MNWSTYLEDCRHPNLWRMLIAEFIACYFYVAIGYIVYMPPAGVLDVSLGFGFAAASLIQATYILSGGHMNPAITMGFTITGELSVLKALFYIIAQCLGAIAGAATLHVVLEVGKKHSVSYVTKKFTPGQGLSGEVLVTFMYVLTFKSYWDRSRGDIRRYAPLGIGLAISAGQLATLNLSGGCMNPARALGPAIMEGYWKNHYVFWIGPCVGSMLAALFYRFVLQDGDDRSSDEETIK